MRNNSLLIFLLSSRKRSGTLFLLLNRPMRLSELKNHFDVKSPEIIPRLKELESKNLIYKKDDKYHLTSFGMVIAKKVKPFIDTFNVIDSNDFF
ncbi:hypothetical protein [Methanocella conradii]|uniref:hypothetical protein n=1 Tax=Methanocella conradii TaxID=1175444 RepID=UPI003F6DCA20